MRASSLSPYHLPLTLISGAIGSDEALDRPRRATDEEAVDVGERGEYPGVAWVDAATVENRNPAAGFSKQVFAPGSDQTGNRFDVLWAGRGACSADRPDRLIGDLNLF